ncbi:LRRC49 [Lepeophtheirus salmonis]|uniref:LRRC49 n=1 Tax=Lepeophtheirus salmonis TaxID=72036 RepID=A0A7R8DB56_LEPSM|nr:LRRC49 [Lepeophtheirus salmonis]CAF3031506.1 LRRC49 [Lepeophtheirus salmonis]
MERSVDEKLKFPDRINIDRKGLHGIPILSEEPGLRLLSLQHNMIKKDSASGSNDTTCFFGFISKSNISSLSNLENLKNLHTVQMEGNPVWSCSEYTFHLVSSLDNLKMLDQQEITTDVRSYAEKWLRNKTDPTVSSANTPTTSVVGGGTARKQLLKKNGGT